MDSPSATSSRIHIALLSFILLLGLLLRIGDPFSMAFINDELSTWDKVSQSSLSDVIDTIHYDDSHPVGLYVLMYYLKMILGDSIWAFKFPFLITWLPSKL